MCLIKANTSYIVRKSTYMCPLKVISFYYLTLLPNIIDISVNTSFYSSLCREVKWKKLERFIDLVDRLLSLPFTFDLAGERRFSPLETPKKKEMNFCYNHKKEKLLTLPTLPKTYCVTCEFEKLPLRGICCTENCFN